MHIYLSTTIINIVTITKTSCKVLYEPPLGAAPLYGCETGKLPAKPHL